MAARKDAFLNNIIINTMEPNLVNRIGNRLGMVMDNSEPRRPHKTQQEMSFLY
jgi:hypothetical protein